MATIKEFKAIRPIPKYAEAVAALPYDVMSSDEARAMVGDNKFSFLHVDKSEIDLDKDINIYDEKVYIQAKENLQNLIAENILSQDADAYLYIYRLTMNGKSQTGLVACTSVDEYLQGTIKKHELTRQDKESDRTKHIDYTNANTGPIFLAYKAQKNIKEALNKITSLTSPVYDFVSDDNVSHVVWVIENKSDIESLKEMFSEVQYLYIADGHHRNASAVNIAKKRRNINTSYSGDEEFNFYLSVIFPDDELQILDYNRVVKDLNNMTAEEFLAAIEEKFIITENKDGQYKPEKLHTFGMYLDNNWYKLEAKQEIIPDNESDALDVSILQNSILTPLLSIHDMRTDKRIDFIGGIRGLSELEQRVSSGDFKVAFALYPTSMTELMSIADKNGIMPPKSTWFEPKLRSGLFIHSLD